MNYDVILVNPLTRFGDPYDNVVEYLGYGYLAAYLREKGYTVKIIDFYVEGYSLTEGVEKLKKYSCELLGFTAMSSIYLKNIRKILSLVNTSISKHICMGGFFVHHLNDTDEWKSLQIDSFIIGEGEETIVELAEAVKLNKSTRSIKGIAYFCGDELVFTRKRLFMTEETLKKLPLPSRDTAKKVLEQNGILQLSGSRGCYGRCTFCAVHEYCAEYTDEHWRPLSISKLVDEIEILVHTYKTNYFDFSDEDFIGPRNRRNRIEYFCDELIKRNLNIRFMIFCRSSDVDKELFQKLKNAGLERVFIGIEFGSDELLNRYRKGTSSEMNRAALLVLRNLDIKSSVGYIMFTPDLTIPLLKENLKFYFDNCQFKLRALSSRLVVYPETEAYYRFKSQNMLGELKWDITFGDYYECEFIDERIRLIYDILREMVIILSKSQSYAKIFELKHRNNLLWIQNMKKWKKDIFNFVFDLIEEVEKGIEVSNDSITHNFINKIMEWDKTYFIIKNT